MAVPRTDYTPEELRDLAKRTAHKRDGFEWSRWMDTVARTLRKRRTWIDRGCRSIFIKACFCFWNQDFHRQAAMAFGT